MNQIHCLAHCVLTMCFNITFSSVRICLCLLFCLSFPSVVWYALLVLFMIAVYPVHIFIYLKKTYRPTDWFMIFCVCVWWCIWRCCHLSIFLWPGCTCSDVFCVSLCLCIPDLVVLAKQLNVAALQNSHHSWIVCGWKCRWEKIDMFCIYIELGCYKNKLSLLLTYESQN